MIDFSFNVKGILINNKSILEIWNYFFLLNSYPTVDLCQEWGVLVHITYAFLHWVMIYDSTQKPIYMQADTKLVRIYDQNPDCCYLANLADKYIMVNFCLRAVYKIGVWS